ncbi:MAG: MBL fold metallo-hydrolase [Gammaproteobacteria bacterium]|nr:MBL fold metallo-hydrolase [Gammaproteobacteria bacterium]
MQTGTRFSIIKTFILSIALALATSTVVAQDATRAITNIAGDVYRFQNNFHFSIFVITDAGVVVTDPINAEAASWLNDQIGELTEQPISHLIYSHSHGDHASGGEFFDDVSNVITHENAPDNIDGVVPTKRFSDTLSVEHGGKTFELSYLGPGHGTDLIAMVIRPENIAFVVDAVSSKRLFYRDFPNSNVDDWINQVKKVESLDFDILAGGHGKVGVKADVSEARVYLEELRAQVLAGLKAGKTVGELQESITMDKYKDWGSYENWLGLNIAGMARYLSQSGAVQ